MKAFNILLLPDGNRRWADKHEITYLNAYKLGSERIVDICTYLSKEGFEEIWLGLARPLNLQRDIEGVIAVLDACLFIKEHSINIGNPINITLGGKLELLPLNYVQKFKEQEKEVITGAFTAHILLGWSTDTEVEKTIKQIFQVEKINFFNKETAMSACDISKHIDLIIRTGVEGKGGRLSGMVPWHSTDAELFFSQELFPNFNLSKFQEALADYNDRNYKNKM